MSIELIRALLGLTQEEEDLIYEHRRKQEQAKLREKLELLTLKRAYEFKKHCQECPIGLSYVDYCNLFDVSDNTEPSYTSVLIVIDAASIFSREEAT